MDIVKLKDLTVDGKGTYGVAAPAVEYQENLPTYLRITDILDDGTLNLSELKSVNIRKWIMYSAVEEHCFLKLVTSGDRTCQASFN